MSIIAKGLVYGYAWGGGEGSYPATTLNFETIEELQKYLNELKDYSCLDSGMGFETVVGAYYNNIQEVIQDGEWTKKRYLDNIWIGKLNDEQIEHLLEAEFYS